MSNQPTSTVDNTNNNNANSSNADGTNQTHERPLSHVQITRRFADELFNKKLETERPDDNKQQNSTETTKPDSSTTPNVAERLHTLALKQQKAEKRARELQKQLDAQGLSLKEYEALKAKMNADKFQFAKETLGLDLNEVVNRYLKGEETTPKEKSEVEQLIERINALETDKKTKEEQEQAQQQAQAQAEKQATWNNHVARLKEENKDDERFALIAALGREEDILHEQVNHYRNTFNEETGEGEQLTDEQAATVIEGRIVDQLKKIFGNSKFNNIYEQALAEMSKADSTQQTSNNTSNNSSTQRNEHDTSDAKIITKNKQASFTLSNTHTTKPTSTSVKQTGNNPNKALYDMANDLFDKRN